MNTITVNKTIQTITANHITASKAGGSDFGIALQGAFSYSEVRGVNAIASTALEMLDDELEDMYVVSDAHRIQLPMALPGHSADEFTDAWHERCRIETELFAEERLIQVPLGPDDLPKLIERIRAGYNNGDTLQNVLEKYQEEHGGKGTALNYYELYTVDFTTGSVIGAHTMARCFQTFPEQIYTDRMTSLAIADDIATVIRYTFNRQETDDGLKIEQLIAGIQSRCTSYSTERFNPIYSTRVEHPNWWYDMMVEKESGEKDASDYNDMIDSLLELLDRHFKAEQKRDAENDDLGSSSLTVAAMAAKIAVSKSSEVSTLAV